MQIDRTLIAALLLESVTLPRSAAARVKSLGGGYALALLAVALVAILSAVVSVLVSLITPPTGNPEMDMLMRQPLLLAGMQAMGMAVFAAIVTGAGRLFGGTGRMDQVLLTIAWLDFLLLALQLVLLMLMLAVPALAGLVSIAAFVIITWLLAAFIAEVHGFASTFRTAAVFLGALLLIGVSLVTLSA